MLYYPQLSTGVVSQLPVSRRTTLRTITNTLPSGDNIRMSDPGSAAIAWQLQYSNLTDAEFLSLETLFQATEGKLTTFTFLDPMDNLLNWSEDWTNAVWAADPLMQVSAGIADPLGGTGAVQLTNTAQTTQRIVQGIAGPSWFQYCCSIYVRSNAPSAIQILFSATGQESLRQVQTGSSWTRAIMAGSLSLQESGISFGLQLPAGASIVAFGAQAEPQPAAGYYKKTTNQAGVYPKTRFDSDSLTQTTSAPDQNSCSVSLLSNLAEG
jgi:hypothetical protein